jgi:hypothetical protein
VVMYVEISGLLNMRNALYVFEIELNNVFMATKVNF